MSYKNKLRGLSPRENYTDSGRRLSAKLVPTFVDEGVLRSQRGRSPKAVISVFEIRATTFSFR
jgi:hypothetical protein